jgi:hypothetical protein
MTDVKYTAKLRDVNYMGSRLSERNKVWDRCKRPSRAPRHPKLDRLMRTWDPAIGFFEVPTTRSGARDLRKELTGTAKGVRNVPDDEGFVVVPLPHGWALALLYDEPGCLGLAGKVIAQFWPPEDAEEGDEKSALHRAPCLKEEVHP